MTPNSRSSLNRWAQPDSIVPLATQGTQAWDRYAYVSNNPLRYTDPSGHGAYCGDDYDPGCLNEEENHLFHQLTDPVKLTKDKEFGQGYDGEMMYKLYLKYKHESNSWWYDVFGGDADGFSVEDFLTVILYHEFSNRFEDYPEDAGKFSYAISEKLSYWCAQYSGGACGGASENAMLNYIAMRGSAYMLYDKHITRGEPFKPVRYGKVFDTHDAWDLNLAQKVTEDALSHITPYGSLADWDNKLDPKTGTWTFNFNFEGHGGILP